MCKWLREYKGNTRQTAVFPLYSLTTALSHVAGRAQDIDTTQKTTEEYQGRSSTAFTSSKKVTFRANGKVVR